MLLSIDQSKINEQLAEHKPHYVVSPCNFEMAWEVGPIEIPTAQITSTENYILPEAERYRERVLALRRSLVERGESPATSSDSLEKIIDEYRGRA
jgi:hypothetical protein